MKSKIYAYLALFLMFACVLSCKEDDDAVPQAAATFTADKSTVKIDEVVQFTNTSQNATAFKWSFGDGTTSKEVAPKKSYTAAGSYLVTLLSTGEGGSTLSSMTITVLPPPDLYFVAYESALIKKVATDGSGLKDFLNVAGQAGVGLAYDDVHGKVYFSDFENPGEGKIWMVNIDGSDLKAIVTGLFDPYSIALDIAGGKIYWAEDYDDNGDGHIYRANLDGTAMEPLVTMTDAEFRGIALDLKNRKMYFYEVYNEDLYIADLDGNNATPILSGVYGYGILVDSENDKIYFDEQNSELLERADLDGSNVETVDDNGTRIYGMAIDSETKRLYWSGRDSGTIESADLDGSNQVTVKAGLASPRGLFLKK